MLCDCEFEEKYYCSVFQSGCAETQSSESDCTSLCGVDLDSFRAASWRTASNGILKAVTLHNSLSTTTCTSVDIFAIVHAVLDRVDGHSRPTRIATLLNLCPAQRSAETFTRLSLCGAILKYTTITNIFLRCHSHRISGGLSKSRIMSAKQPKL